MTEAAPGGRAVLVGMMNPYESARLYTMLEEARPGTAVIQYKDKFKRLNLCKGLWNAEKAELTSHKVLMEHEGGTILLLGREVQAAFGVVDPASFGCVARRAAGSKRYTYLLWAPHTGSLWEWNDPANRERMGRMLGRLMDGQRGLLAWD